MHGAVRTLLETVGEDPDREGVLATPDRYAKAMLEFTRGYQENIEDIVNNALFHENHRELVIVKDIELHRFEFIWFSTQGLIGVSNMFPSLCEHHLVPFFGKVRSQHNLCLQGLRALIRII